MLTVHEPNEQWARKDWAKKLKVTQKSIQLKCYADSDERVAKNGNVLLDIKPPGKLKAHFFAIVRYLVFTAVVIFDVECKEPTEDS
jgi:hypothetical protein